MVQAISMVLVPTVMDGWVRCVPVTVRAGWLTQLVEFLEQVDAVLKTLAPADAPVGSGQEDQES